MNLYGNIIRTIEGKSENWHKQKLKTWAENMSLEAPGEHIR